MVKCTAEGCDKRAYFGVEHKKPLRCGQLHVGVAPELVQLHRPGRARL